MKRAYGDFIEDILNAIRETTTFTQDMSFQNFAQDPRTVNAVIRSLEVIGEAAKNIPHEIRRKTVTIPWRRMAGMRDKLIHDYFGVDLEIVWAVVKEELPPLQAQLQALLQIVDREEDDSNQPESTCTNPP